MPNTINKLIMDPVVHFEVPFDNSERANKFYEGVFGWKITPIKDSSVEYTMAYTDEVDEQYMPKKKGVINGGMFQREEALSHPTIVIQVNSIDEYEEKVEKAGGKFISKSKVGDMGYYARIKDSEGNVIGIWEDIKQ